MGEIIRNLKKNIWRNYKGIGIGGKITEKRGRKNI